MRSTRLRTKPLDGRRPSAVLVRRARIAAARRGRRPPAAEDKCISTIEHSLPRSIRLFLASVRSSSVDGHESYSRVGRGARENGQSMTTLRLLMTNSTSGVATVVRVQRSPAVEASPAPGSATNRASVSCAIVSGSGIRVRQGALARRRSNFFSGTTNMSGPVKERFVNGGS